MFTASIAAKDLAQHGIKASVINARFAKPLDQELITQTARGTGHILTIEENSLAGGFGSAVPELLSDNGIASVKVCRLGLPDKVCETWKPGNPEKACGS